MRSEIRRANLTLSNSDQILQAVLPEDLLDESPTAFTQVGHIGMFAPDQTSQVDRMG